MKPGVRDLLNKYNHDRRKIAEAWIRGDLNECDLAHVAGLVNRKMLVEVARESIERDGLLIGLLFYLQDSTSEGHFIDGLKKLGPDDWTALAVYAAQCKKKFLRKMTVK